MDSPDMERQRAATQANMKQGTAVRGATAAQRQHGKAESCQSVARGECAAVTGGAGQGDLVGHKMKLAPIHRKHLMIIR